jgi:glycosyltransferase involved in cell wall biosynthesis
MKKVLIIANLFHASPRIPGIAQYLSEFGWQPTILTVPIEKDPRNRLGFPAGFQEKIRIIETPYQGDVFWFWRKLFKLLGFNLSKSILNQAKEKIGITSQKSFIDHIFNFYMTLVAYPDEEKGWKRPALRVANKLLGKEKFDAIISSSSPVTAHIIAKKIKEKYNILWLADLRDLWTQNHDYSYPFIRKVIERRLEKKTLSSADALLTVSQPLVETLKKLHTGKKVFSITNGFYPEELNSPPKPLKNKFAITYAGTVYTGKQDPKDFFIAFKKLIDEKIINSKDVDVRFYSGILPWLDKEIEDYNLNEMVKVYEKTPKNEIIERQNESQILLLIYWGDRTEKGWQSLKIFGYLAAQRPILVINGYGGDVIEKTINETKSGVYCKNVRDIKEALKKFYFDYKNNGRVSYGGDIEKIKKYSYYEKAKEFSQVLEKTMNDYS